MKRKKKISKAAVGVRPNKPAKEARETIKQAIAGYKRALFLRSFADAGRAPKMTDVEVAVCFADLRGFTNYVHRLQRDGQDNKVQHFLKDYFMVYPRSVLARVLDYEPESSNEEMSAVNTELRRLIVPTSYKNLGDGLMIVWELQDASSARMQGLATRSILRIIHGIQERFATLTTDLSPVQLDAYSQYASDLRMGFGLAKGHAWRLEFGYHSPPDYAGSIVNLAARLQGLARPSGIVAQLGFSESKFREFVKEKVGSIETIPSPKGLGTEPIQVWRSSDVCFPPDSKTGSVLDIDK